MQPGSPFDSDSLPILTRGPSSDWRREKKPEFGRHVKAESVKPVKSLKRDLDSTLVKPAERLRLSEGSLPGSNKEVQFLCAGVDPHGLDRFEDAPLPAISDRQAHAGL